jgi:hypothetical protein
MDKSISKFYEKIYLDKSYFIHINYENIRIERHILSYINKNIGSFYELNNKDFFHKYYLYHTNNDNIIIIIRHGSIYYWTTNTINFILI